MNEGTEAFFYNQATSTSPVLFPSFDGSLFFPVSNGNVDSNGDNPKVMLKKFSVTTAEIVFIFSKKIFSHFFSYFFTFFFK